MFLPVLLFIPIIGIFIICTNVCYNSETSEAAVALNNQRIKRIGLGTSIVNLFVSLLIFVLFDFSANQFQFVQEYYQVSSYDFYLGVDGLSIYFVLLTTIIVPIALLSN